MIPTTYPPPRPVPLPRRSAFVGGAAQGSRAGDNGAGWQGRDGQLTAQPRTMASHLSAACVGYDFTGRSASGAARTLSANYAAGGG